MSQQNLEIVRRAFDEMGSEGDEGGVWARDVEVINAEGWVIETVYRGHEGLRRWREDLAEAFGDFRIVVEDVLEVDEQRVLTTQRFVGRFRATEIPFDGRWASILWVRDGKIVRAQGHLSKRRAMRAAGLTPGLVDDSERAVIERVLARPVSNATKAAWGFTNRTDIVTLAGGERVVVQRYRRRQDAEYRLRVMRGLWRPAAEAGISIPRVRESDLDAAPGLGRL